MSRRRTARPESTSALAFAEVAFLGGPIPDADAEAMIKEFFGRDYVITINLDELVGERARELVRLYSKSHKLTPEDAVYMASALVWDIPRLETRDTALRSLSSKETCADGTPLVIEPPKHQVVGPARLF